MPNPLRGETTLTVEEKTYACASRGTPPPSTKSPPARPLSVGVQEILDGKVSARSLRAMLWAGLQEHHPDVSLKDAARCSARSA